MRLSLPRRARADREAVPVVADDSPSAQGRPEIPIDAQNSSICFQNTPDTSLCHRIFSSECRRSE